MNINKKEKKLTQFIVVKWGEQENSRAALDTFCKNRLNLKENYRLKEFLVSEDDRAAYYLTLEKKDALTIGQARQYLRKAGDAAHEIEIIERPFRYEGENGKKKRASPILSGFSAVCILLLIVALHLHWIPALTTLRGLIIYVGVFAWTILIISLYSKDFIKNLFKADRQSADNKNSLTAIDYMTAFMIITPLLLSACMAISPVFFSSLGFHPIQLLVMAAINMTCRGIIACMDAYLQNKKIKEEGHKFNKRAVALTEPFRCYDEQNGGYHACRYDEIEVDNTIVLGLGQSLRLKGTIEGFRTVNNNEEKKKEHEIEQDGSAQLSYIAINGEDTKQEKYKGDDCEEGIKNVSPNRELFVKIQEGSEKLVTNLEKIDSQIKDKKEKPLSAGKWWPFIFFVTLFVALIFIVSTGFFIGFSAAFPLIVVGCISLLNALCPNVILFYYWLASVLVSLILTKKLGISCTDFHFFNIPLSSKLLIYLDLVGTLIEYSETISIKFSEQLNEDEKKDYRKKIAAAQIYHFGEKGNGYAECIVGHIKAKGITLQEINSVTETLKEERDNDKAKGGIGVSFQRDNSELLIGSQQYITQIMPSILNNIPEEKEDCNYSYIVYKKPREDAKLIGVIKFPPGKLKSGAAEALHYFIKNQINIQVLSGSRKGFVDTTDWEFRRILKDEFSCSDDDLNYFKTPLSAKQRQEKANIVEASKGDYCAITVGDELNDEAMFKAAHFSISASSNAAINDEAHPTIILKNNNIKQLPVIFKIVKMTQRARYICMCSLFFWLFVSLLSIGLFSFFFGVLPPLYLALWNQLCLLCSLLTNVIVIKVLEAKIINEFKQLTPISNKKLADTSIHPIMGNPETADTMKQHLDSDTIPQIPLINVGKTVTQTVAFDTT